MNHRADKITQPNAIVSDLNHYFSENSSQQRRVLNYAEWGLDLQDELVPTLDIHISNLLLDVHPRPRLWIRLRHSIASCSRLALLFLAGSLLVSG